MQKDPQLTHQKYKLPYQQCKLHLQKLNYICLDPKCHQKSLICSICKDQNQHLNHSIRPLKFYLQELQQKYIKSQGQSSLNKLLDDLEISQYTFYQKLKKAVEQVALQFQKLQEQVTQQISKIRNQIFQEIAKRSRFNEFYQSLKRGHIDHSNFVIQNYLPQSSVGKISGFDKLQKLSFDICQQIYSTKSAIITRQSTDSLQKQKKQPKVINLLDLKSSIKKPDNILFDNGILTQTQIYGGKSLCLIDYPVYKLSGKLSFKILQLKKASSIIISVMPKPVYQSMTQVWMANKLIQNCFALGPDGFNKGWQKSQITQFGQGSTLQLYYKSGQLKIGQKNKSCTAKMPIDIDLYVVIALVGDCQVRINHQK